MSLERGWTASGGRRLLLCLLPLLLLYLAVPLLVGPAQPQDDEAVYLRIAERIADGRYADPGGSDADYLWYPPGLPLVLAPMVAAELPLDAIRLLGPLALFGAVALFALLLRRFVSSRMALLGAYAFGLYPPFLILVRRTFSEPLALLLLTAGMLFTARALESRRRGDVLAAGAAFAGLALTRAAFGWILVGLLVLFGAWWVVAGRARQAATAAAVFAVAVALTTPWLAYTYSLTERPLYWGNSGGLSLYWMASPHPGDLGDWRPYGDVPPPHRPFFRTLEPLGPVERDVELQRRALELIREQPAEYVANIPPNLSRLLFDTPYTSQRQELSSLGYALPNALLLGAFALCLPLLLLRRRSLPFAGVVFLAFGAIAFAFHLLLSAEPRMLTPVVPVAIWAIVYAVGRLARFPAPEPASRSYSDRHSATIRPAP